jgi:hypothetical protein
MTMGVETEEVPEGLDGNDGAGERVPFGNDIPYEDLQRFPGTATQIVQKKAIIEDVPSQDLRDAEDEMPVGHLFEHVGA